MALNMIYCDFIKFRFNATSHNHFYVKPLFHDEIEKVYDQIEKVHEYVEKVHDQPENTV